MADRSRAAREVLAITVIVSACSLMYELLIAQTLSLLAGNTVTWYSLTVGAYLGSMGLGAVIYNARAPKNGWNALFGVEVLLCVVGAGAVLIIQLAHSLHLYVLASSELTGAAPPGVLVFFGTSLVTIIIVGTLSGIELPLLMRLGNDVSEDGKLTNRVLGWDYIGALAAGLLFPLALVPYLDLAIIGLGTGMVNLLVGAYILRRFVTPGRGVRLKTALCVVFGGLLLFGISQGPGMQQYFLKRYYYTPDAAEMGSRFGPLNELPDVQRVYSPYQKIDLVNDSSPYWGDQLIDAYSTKYIDDPTLPRNQYLFLNGDFQFNSDYEELYHEWFTHVPVILNGKVPERVLVLGAGDGLLMRELVKYDGIRSITHVDLDSRLVALANTHPTLTAMNRGAFGDPRVDTQFGDAFQYVRRSRESFDAVYLDFPYVMDYNLSKLYSREFFHFVRDRLAEGGYAVLDAPAENFNPEPDREGYLQFTRGRQYDIYYNTIRSAGFEDIVPFATRLEEDNPVAFEILDAWSETPPRPEPGPNQELQAAMRRETMRQYVQRHADNLEQAFIVMWKHGREARTPVYRDFGVEMSALNENRFALAFPPPFSTSARIDLFRVNSILRPTLPLRSFLTVRKPW